MRPESDGPDDPAKAYEAVSLKCWGCETRELAQRDAIEANKGRPLSGSYWGVTERRNGSR